MLKSFLTGAAALSLVSGAALAADHHGDKKTDTVMVGGAKMYASKNIVENASKAPNLTTLVAAVKAADLVETLSSEGPFTVFAPTNDAFAEVQSSVDMLLKPENKEKLQGVLTYHVVSGSYDAASVIELIEDAGGEAEVATVAGGTLTLSLEGGKVIVTDENGGSATVTTADVKQSNGVVHVIDAVLMPAM